MTFVVFASSTRKKDELLAVLPATHPLSTRASIDLAELCDEAFVMFSKTLVPGLRAAVIEACREAGFVPKVAQEATQALTVIALVGTGIGVAIVPAVIREFTNEQVRFVRLTDRKSRNCLTLSLAMHSENAYAAATRLCNAIAEKYANVTRGADADNEVVPAPVSR